MSELFPPDPEDARRAERSRLTKAARDAEARRDTLEAGLRLANAGLDAARLALGRFDRAAPAPADDDARRQWLARKKLLPVECGGEQIVPLGDELVTPSSIRAIKPAEVAASAGAEPPGEPDAGESPGEKEARERAEDETLAGAHPDKLLIRCDAQGWCHFPFDPHGGKASAALKFTYLSDRCFAYAYLPDKVEILRKAGLGVVVVLPHADEPDVYEPAPKKRSRKKKADAREEAAKPPGCKTQPPAPADLEKDLFGDAPSSIQAIKPGRPSSAYEGGL